MKLVIKGTSIFDGKVLPMKNSLIIYIQLMGETLSYTRLYKSIDVLCIAFVTIFSHTTFHFKKN